MSELRSGSTLATNDVSIALLNVVRLKIVIGGTSLRNDGITDTRTPSSSIRKVVTTQLAAGTNSDIGRVAF